MTMSVLDSFSDLTSIDWSITDSSNTWNRCPLHQWSSFSEFRCRNTFFGFHATGQCSRNGVTALLRKLWMHPIAQVCVFVNFKGETNKVATLIESALTSNDPNVHVVQIHGDMDTPTSSLPSRLCCPFPYAGGNSCSLTEPVGGKSHNDDHGCNN